MFPPGVKLFLSLFLLLSIPFLKLSCVLKCLLEEEIRAAKLLIGKIQHFPAEPTQDVIATPKE